MSDREYLRSLGFTVGERGRFSKEMLAALAARSEREKDEFVSHISVPAVPVREARPLYGYTKDGHMIEFLMCSRCAEHMMWCECPNGVMAPDNVFILDKDSEDVACHHPRMLQLTTVA